MICHCFNEDIALAIVLVGLATTTLLFMDTLAAFADSNDVTNLKSGNQILPSITLSVVN
jgi:hypothetical protein